MKFYSPIDGTTLQDSPRGTRRGGWPLMKARADSESPPYYWAYERQNLPYDWQRACCEILKPPKNLERRGDVLEYNRSVFAHAYEVIIPGEPWINRLKERKSGERTRSHLYVMIQSFHGRIEASNGAQQKVLLAHWVLYTAYTKIIEGSTR